MFRFTIRELLLLTVVAALSVCWWIDRSRLAVKAREKDEWEFRANAVAERFRAAGQQVKWTEAQVFTTETRGGKTFQRVNKRR